MTDPRLNRRAPRVNGRARSERRDADRAMQIWAWWWLEQRERGWPCESMESRLMAHAGELVRATTPLGPRVPDVDRARYGPRVNRLLADMEAEGLPQEALVLKLYALAGVRRGRVEVAAVLKIEVSEVKGLLETGRGWMDEQLRLVPLEVRRAGQADRLVRIDSPAPVRVNYL